MSNNERIRKPKRISPTQRALADLRRMGYRPAVVERWNPYARIRQDLYGCIDLIGIRPGEILGVQTTSGTNHAARRSKALAEPAVREWLAAGGRFEIWSYAKRGARGERKLWERRVEAVTLEMVEGSACTASTCS